MIEDCGVFLLKGDYRLKEVYAFPIIQIVKKRRSKLYFRRENFLKKVTEHLLQKVVPERNLPYSMNMRVVTNLVSFRGPINTVGILHER